MAQVAISISLEPELVNELDKQAQKEVRTRSTMVAVLIREALDRRKKAK